VKFSQFNHFFPKVKSFYKSLDRLKHLLRIITLGIITINLTGCPKGEVYTGIYVTIRCKKGEETKIEKMDIKAMVDSTEIILEYKSDSTEKKYYRIWYNRAMESYINNAICYKLKHDTFTVFTDTVLIKKDCFLICDLWADTCGYSYEKKIAIGDITGDISDTLWINYDYEMTPRM